jgi:hypothetical protein
VKAAGKLRKFLLRYPTPEILARANVQDVTEILKTLGLRNRRANTLIAFARGWLENPPTKYVGVRKPGYPRRETLEAFAFPGISPIAKDERFEIAHLPGVGPYALDSWRIFCLDDLRGNEDGDEWTRVTPLDKELRGLLRWRWWAKKGIRWVEEGDSEAFNRSWVIECDGSVCHNMCTTGFPTQRCPHGELDLANPENRRGHIPPEFVIGGGKKEAIGDQIDIPDPAIMADYIPFGHATFQGSLGGTAHVEAANDAQSVLGLPVGGSADTAMPADGRGHLHNVAPQPQAAHHLQRSEDFNASKGIPPDLPHLEAANDTYFALDPPAGSNPLCTALLADGVYPYGPAPQPQSWMSQQGQPYEHFMSPQYCNALIKRAGAPSISQDSRHGVECSGGLFPPYPRSSQPGEGPQEGTTREPKM